VSAELLQALGPIPSTLITLDWEAFWDPPRYGLRVQTTEAYVRDPRFEGLGISVKVGHRPPVWMEEWDFRKWAKRVPWRRVAVAAHHAHFDGFILSQRYGIRPGFWIDTLSMGRVLHGTEVGGSLGKLALHYGVGVKGDEVENTKGKHRADLSQAAWDRLGVYANNDVDLTERLVRKMVPLLPRLELWLIDLTVRCFTEPAFEGDMAVLEKSGAEERAKKIAVLRRVAKTAGKHIPENASEAEVLEGARAVLGSSDQFAALLRSMGEEPPTKPGKHGPIFAFAKSDPGMKDLLEHKDDEIRALAEARLAVKSNIVETRTERMKGIVRRGRVPFYLKYSGAHTHRWSGGDKMNPQNFNRGGALRAAIRAPKGCVLVVADSGQIEARKVAWVAGELELLKTFRRNDLCKGDFYSDEGSRYFGRKLSKEETPVERQTSKSMVLGLGFNMGWLKFAGELLKGMLGAPSVQFTVKEARLFGVDVARFVREAKERVYGRPQISDYQRIEQMICRIDMRARVIHCAVVHHLVTLYREKNARIAGYWKAAGNVLQAMVQGTEMQFGCLQVRKDSLMKPSGLVLRYPGLRKSGDQYVYRGGHSGREWKKIYGGLLTENIVQSLARDVVAEQALWIKAAGYEVKTTTHDEIVCVVPEEKGPECLAYMLERMKIPPAWCADLPLNASGGFAKSYGAVK
jgi:hypothetical protein